MKRRKLSEFVDLYPRETRRSLRWALIWSVLLAVLDFVSLLLLLPVFSVLTSGGSQSAQDGGITDVVLGGITPGILVLIAMVVMIARSLAGFGVRLWWTRRVARAEVSLSSELLHAYAYTPYEFHLRRNSADLLSRAVAHVNLATASGLNGLVLLATDATTVVALSAALFVASPVAGGLVFGYLAIIGYGFIYLSRRFTATQARRYADEVAQVYRRASTLLRGIRELTVAGGRNTVLQKVEQSRMGMVRAQRYMLVLTDLPRMILETALYAAILLALLLVLNSAHPGDELPIVAIYVIAGLRVLPAISRGLGNLTQLRSGVEIGHQVAMELAAAKSVDGHTPTGVRLPRDGDLVVDAVSFKYAEGGLVLDDIGFAVPFGTFQAIVGPSGSGKSTLLSLILGLLAPTSGLVTYGGIPVSLADPEWLRHVGYVPQEAFVLDDNVRNNVALGDALPDDFRVWQSLARAALEDVVRLMPDQLDTELGENGSRLSVGQRQRLGIARALYRDPSILILDEPTAALDHANEAAVMRTVEALKGSLTIILVAHRLETIAAADQIVRLYGGRLIAGESSLLKPAGIQ